MTTKLYKVFEAGGSQLTTLHATCITKAIKRFITTIEEPVSYELQSKQQAVIRYKGSRLATSDFVIYEA
jgi:hypothetical protein